MTAEQIIGLSLALLIMGVGLVGSILPGVPSTPLVMLAVIGHRLYFGDASVGNWGLVTLGGLMVLSLVMDYLASMLGARKLGATRRGVLGAVLGGMIGIFFGPAGVILGPFLGAVGFEMIGGREWKEASRAGLGAVLGLLVGALGKLACCTAMIGLFATNVILRTMNGKPAKVVALWAGLD